jgi:hypothetical protein
MRKTISSLILLGVLAPVFGAQLLVRDPFLPGSFFTADSELSNAKSSLQHYPIEKLSMVGSVQLDDETWGIIQTPTGFLRVRCGDLLGKYTGKIMEITPRRIKIMEKTTVQSEKIIELKLRRKHAL